MQPHAKGGHFCPMDAEVSDPATLASLADLYKALEESTAGMKLLLAGVCRNDPPVGGACSTQLFPRPRGQLLAENLGVVPHVHREAAVE